MSKICLSLSPTHSEFGPLLFSGDLPRGMKEAQDLGYDGVELSLADSTQMDRKWLSRALRESGLKAFGIATGQAYYSHGYALYTPDDAKRNGAEERLRDHVRLAAEIGSMVIVGGLRGKGADRGEAWESAIEMGNLAFRRTAEFASKHGVTLLLEPVNRYEVDVVHSVDDALALIESLGIGRQVMLLVDTFHMNIEEASLTESICRAGSQIGYVHFSDSNRLAPGMGHIDFPAVLSALEEIGFDGPIGIEVLPKPDDHSAAKKAISYLRSIL